jgi:hypothetical protein
VDGLVPSDAQLPDTFEAREGLLEAFRGWRTTTRCNDPHVFADHSS